MKMILPPFICMCFFNLNILQAQVPDWSTRIAPIIYNNCSSCHHPGGIGPFSLLNYQDVIDHAGAVQQAVQEKSMPPWPADPNYRSFANEALLDSAEIQDIVLWMVNGQPIGDTSLAPPAPVFGATGSLLDTIDYTVQIAPYTLQYNTDEYRYFAFHTNFADTVYISKIEVIPGLPQIVHHADIHYDLTGISFTNDSVTPLPGFSGGLTSTYYINAWQPGGNIAEYPPNWGIAIPPGADFVFEIHYGPGGQGLTDTTKMNLQFIHNPSNVRPIYVKWILNNPIPAEGPLIIPANTVTTFHQQSQAMPQARSLISICPHMHMLGKSYKVWYKTQLGDSVPLVNIPHWDFHWQKYYMFRQVQKIPAGAKIYSVAQYDNTVNNPHNPNNPPITVNYGSTTHDEMLMTYIIYADYEQGDEDIWLEDTTTATALVNEISTDNSGLLIYPNPAHDYIACKISTGYEEDTRLQVTNMLGAIMTEIKVSGVAGVEKIDISGYAKGIYFVELLTQGSRVSRKLIKL